MSMFESFDPTLVEQVCAPCVTPLARENKQFVPMYCLRYQQPYRTVLMAVASRRNSKCIRHSFEEANEFLIYEASCHEVRFVGRCQVPATRTASDVKAQLARTIRALDGCEVVLCARIDHRTWQVLEQAGIEPNNKHPSESVEDAIRQVYHLMLAAGRLNEPEKTIPVNCIERRATQQAHTLNKA